MKSALKITLLYIAFASLWIIVSDRFIELTSANVNLVSFYSSIKGLVFVLVTGSLLFWLVFTDSKKKQEYIERLHTENEQKKQLIKELHHRISSNANAIKTLLLNDKEHDSPEGKDRIISKIISMESVFNILYDNPDFDRLTAKDVFDEYIKVSKRNLTVTHTYQFNSFNVETLVSLLLVIDSIIDCLIIDNAIKKIDMNIKSEGNITLTFELVDRQLPELLGHCISIINHFLEHISGTLELQNDYVSHIVILFSDQNPA